MNREKTGGRKKGTPNKTTREFRNQISDILSEHFTPEKVAENLEQIEPKERLQFLVKLIDYVTPKLRTTDSIKLIEPVQELSPEERQARIKVLRAKLMEEE